MNLIKIENHDSLALLRLENGVTNAISPLLVDELIEAIGIVEDNFKGAVLGGGDKFFCIGLELPTLLRYDREQMSLFWDRFDQALLSLYSLPIPLAAAINGHAVAGGAILAMTADYRYIAEGRNLIGLNEINIGLPVPFLADLILRQLIGDRAASNLIYGGDLSSPEDALALGLVDDILPENRVEAHALKNIALFADKPQPAFEMIKNNRTESVRRIFAQQRNTRKEELLDCWFRPAVKEMLIVAAEKF